MCEAYLPFPLTLAGGSFPSLGQFPHTSTNQCSANYLKGILYISQTLFNSVFSKGWYSEPSLPQSSWIPFCLISSRNLSGPTFQSLPSLQLPSQLPFPEPQPLNSLKILAWGNNRGHFICSLVLSNQYPLLPGVQYIKKYYFAYLFIFCCCFW